MYDVPELKQRFIIIRHSNIDDATTLDENYRQLIKESSNSDEREQFIILHSVTQRRINKLLDSNE